MKIHNNLLKNSKMILKKLELMAISQVEMSLIINL